MDPQLSTGLVTGMWTGDFLEDRANLRVFQANSEAPQIIDILVYFTCCQCSCLFVRLCISYYSVCFVAIQMTAFFFHTSKVVELCSKEIANKLRVIDKAGKGGTLAVFEVPVFSRVFQVAYTWSGDSWMYPDPNVSRNGKSLYKHLNPGYLWFFFSPRTTRLNTIFIPWGPHVRIRGPHPSKRPLTALAPTIGNH